MSERDVRCPHCHKLLFRAEGHGALVSIQCPRCKLLLEWPDVERPAIKSAPIKKKGGQDDAPPKVIIAE